MVQGDMFEPCQSCKDKAKQDEYVANWMSGILIVALVLGVIFWATSSFANHSAEAIACFKLDDTKSIIDAKADMKPEEYLTFEDNILDGKVCGMINLQINGTPNFLYSRKIDENMVLSAVKVTLSNGKKVYATIMTIKIIIEEKQEGESI